MFESLGGTRNPLLQEVRLSAEEEKQMEQLEDEAKAKEEQELEAEFNEVWNNAGRKVSESVVGLLGLDDFDDIEPCDSPVIPVDDPGLVAGQGFVDGFAAIQRIWSELQEPSEMSEINGQRIWQRAINELIVLTISAAQTPRQGPQISVEEISDYGEKLANNVLTALMAIIVGLHQQRKTLANAQAKGWEGMRGDRNQHFFFDLDAPNRVVTCRQSVLEKV